MKAEKLLLAIVTLFIWSCGASTSSKSTDQLEGWETYSKDGYSIQFPKDWQLNKEGQMGSEFAIFAPAESEIDKFRENVNLVIQDVSAYNLDLNAYAELSEKQITDMFTGAQILESGKKQNNDKSFYKMAFTATQGIFQLKFIQYYWVENKKAYVLTFTAEENKFDTFWNEGEKIMNSFVFNN